MHRPDVDLHLTGVSSAEGGGEEGLADPLEQPSEVQAELMDKGYVIVPAISHNSGTRAHVGMDTATTWVEPQPVTRDLLQETSRILWKVRPEGTRAVEKVVKASQQYYGISPSCKLVRNRVRAISTEVGAPEKALVHADYFQHQWNELGSRGSRTPVWKCMPCSAIWASLAAFQIWIVTGLCRECMSWNGGRCASCPAQLVEVPRGHVLFLSARCWHAGGPHLSMWPRWFAFIAPDEVIPPNQEVEVTSRGMLE